MRSFAAIYGVTLAAVAAAMLARWLLDPLLGDHLPFVTFFVAVIVAAWAGGLRPALLATALGFLAALFLFVPPRLSVFGTTGPHLVGLTMYFLVSLTIAAFGEAMRAAQHQLAEQGERLRTTLASIGDAVLATDPEGRITTMNAVAESLTGWTREQAAGQPLDAVFRIVNEETRQPVENPAAKALREGVIVGLANHTVLIARDGTERPIDDSAAPIRCKAGEVVGCVLVFRDVSDRRQVERLVADARAYAENIVDTVREPLVVLDADLRVKTASRSFYQTFHVTPEETENRRIYDLGNRQWDIPPLRNLLEEVLPRDSTFNDYEVEHDFPVIGPRVMMLNARRVFREGNHTALILLAIEDVTERKLEQKSARRLAALVESSEDAIISKSLEGIIQSWNAAAERLFGHTAEQAVGRHISFLFPADRLDEEDQIIARLRGGERVEHFDTVRVRSDGRPVHVSLTISPVKDEAGRVAGASKIVRDITERKEAEERLRASEERFRTLFNTMDEGFCVVEMEFDGAGRATDYRIVEMNPAFGRHTGLSDLVGKSVRQSIPGLEEFWFETYGQVARTGEPTRFEHQAVPMGERWFDVYAFRLGGDGSNKVAILFTDISTRKQHEREREATQGTLFTLIERCPFGIYIVGPDFRIRNVNAGSQAGAFANVRPLIGRPFDEAIRILWPEPLATDLIQTFRHTLDTGEPYNSKYFVSPRADIEQTEGYEWELHRIALPDGQFGVVCYYYDSTKLRQVEQALRESDQRKDEFLATLAHELRNPLAPLRNGLQVMKLAKSSPESIEQARSMMERQLGQMVHLIDDLMDLSRISRGKVELRKDRVELSKIVHQSVETSRPLLEDRGHDFTLDVPDEPIYMDADVTRLAQVFSNLLNNAAKYTDRGGRIRLSVERRGGEAVVRVKDNGVGIPAPMLPKVFDIFTQVDRSLEKAQGGLGIGLSLVKAFVEMHGGAVEARSAGHGLGSEFVVTLPVALAQAEKPPKLDQGKPDAPPARRRILVADDNVDAATSLAKLLHIMGNEVRTANDGLAAVEAAAAFRPDVVLLDIGMPKLNGYDACRRIREEAWGEGMVLVALTGWGQEDDRKQSREAGFDHHVVKPVDPAALDKLLAGLVATRA